jgi:uridine kinase
VRGTGGPVVVGVAGGSGAGKTTAVRRITELLGPDSVLVIHHDAYYRDLSHLSPTEREQVNYDHPDALETGLLVRHLEALRDGRRADIPSYDFARHVRRPHAGPVEPRPVIVVDGMLALADERLRRLMDLKVFVDTPDQARLDRRLRRDVIDRGRTPRSVLSQYHATVWPMHRQFVEPSRTHADILLLHGGHDPRGIMRVVEKVREILAARPDAHP